MIGWAGDLREALARGPAALVTILATEGSSPREAGTRMIVTADEAHGTVGGGQLEYRLIEQARAILGEPPGAWRVQDYPLGPLLGQCCGGRVRVLVEHGDPAEAGWLADVEAGSILAHRFTADRIVREPSKGVARRPSARGAKPEVGTILIERLEPPRRPLLLFGAGHVGRAIALRAAGLPLALAWFDTRAEAAEVDGVALVEAERIASCAEQAPADAAILILTHDHALDYTLTAAALRGPAAFVGLIGSGTKRARFLARLDQDGFDAAARARLTCPIGLPGITGKEPEVIAIAALAQILSLPMATA